MISSSIFYLVVVRVENNNGQLYVILSRQITSAIYRYILKHSNIYHYYELRQWYENWCLVLSNDAHLEYFIYRDE